MRELAAYDNFEDFFVGVNSPLNLASDKRNIIIFNKDGQYKIVGRLPDEIFKTDKTVRMSVVGWKNGHDKIPRACRVIMQGAMPLKPHVPSVVRPDFSDIEKKTATVFLQDVYHGRNMEGVERGTIEKLLVKVLKEDDSDK